MFRIKFLLALLVSLVFIMGSAPSEAANPCNPCAKNACNPCAKNACNPCAKNACNPCAKNACNPCGGKPPTPIRSEHVTDQKKLVAMGKKLWNDEKLGNSGFSCMTCHEDHEKLNIGKHRGVWPHYVDMPKDIVTFTQMINFCMINPMEGKQIEPNSITMTAFQAYYTEYIKSFKGENPCAMKRRKNPCNPCGR